MAKEKITVIKIIITDAEIVGLKGDFGSGRFCRPVGARAKISSITRILKNI
jgi:hypothetical protein